MHHIQDVFVFKFYWPDISITILKFHWEPSGISYSVKVDKMAEEVAKRLSNYKKDRATICLIEDPARYSSSWCHLFLEADLSNNWCGDHGGGEIDPDVIYGEFQCRQAANRMLSAERQAIAILIYDLKLYPFVK